jgi:two-component system response regulator (stage 0 sporulation protein F)
MDMCKVLLGEDDKNFGMVLKRELEENLNKEYQYQVNLVPDGVEAVLSFISVLYDFVLLDIRMPRLNGNDALRIIKKINPNVPTITFSGNAGSSEMEESVECGAIKCIKKPFAIAKLKNDMRNHLTALK